jgi:UrcA family protein
MNIAVAKLQSTLALSLAFAAGVSSIACAQNPADSLMLIKSAVNYSDLNLDTPAGGMTLYRRLKGASHTVCRQLESMVVYLPHGYSECVEAALGRSVHDVNRASLARAYLGEHRAAIAANYGIEDTIQLVAK